MRRNFILPSLLHHIFADKQTVNKMKGTNELNCIVKLGDVLIDYNFCFMGNISLFISSTSFLLKK